MTTGDMLASPALAGCDAAIIIGRCSTYPAWLLAALRAVNAPVICVLPPDPAEEVALLDAGVALCLAPDTGPRDLVRWMDRLIDLARAPWPQPFSFDPVRRQACYDGRAMRVRPLAFDLLFLLAGASGRPLSSARLAARLWPADGATETARQQRLLVQVHHLRRALAAVGAIGWLRTVPGVGYALSAPHQSRSRGSRAAGDRRFLGNPPDIE